MNSKTDRFELQSSGEGDGDAMSNALIFMNSHWRDEPERAIVAVVAANSAAIAGQTAIIFCTMDAVRLGTEGGSEGLALDGFPDPAEVLPEFIDNGGELWLCGTCAKPRGITEDQLVKGARVVGAAKLLEEVIAGAKTISLS